LDELRSLPQPNRPNQFSNWSWRRSVVGVFSITCLLIGGYQTTIGSGDGLMGRSVFLRAGVAFLMLWIAWPSLVRPAKWLPPGILLLAMIGLAILIGQPKLIPAVLPLFGFVTVAAIVITYLRRFW
jgi:hypothetical protein